MTEQEIVKRLKDNMSKGTAFMFMPEEVWDWVMQHLDEPKLMYLAPNGSWNSVVDSDFDDYDNVVFTLFGDYEVKEEESEQKHIADSMLLAARVLHSNCIKINCQKCVLCRNEECILNLHPLYWNI